MSTFHTEALLADREPLGGGTELEFNDVPYTHPILKADVRLKDMSIPQIGNTEPDIIRYTHPILNGSLRLALPGRVVYYDIRTSGAVFYSDFPHTGLILKGSLHLT